MMRETTSHAGLLWKASLDGDNRYMDGGRQCEDIGDSREILDLHRYIYILSFKLTYIPNK